MGIRIDGNTDLINAADGSVTIAGQQSTTSEYGGSNRWCKSWNCCCDSLHWSACYGGCTHYVREMVTQLILV